MRLVEWLVDFLKVKDQIGRGCDRELAGGRRLPADGRHRQQND